MIGVFDTPEFSSKLKSVLLETFDALIRFLDKNELRWYVAYGTALGAVRHKGFIPWDDDIDIYMPREDYEVLLAKRDCLLSHNLELKYFIDKGYNYTFAKVFNASTTIWEAPQFPFVIGAWVDIFPLDRAFRSDFRQLADNYIKRFYRSEVSSPELSLTVIKSYLKRKQYKSLLSSLLKKVLVNSDVDSFFAYHKEFVQNQQGDIFYEMTVKSLAYDSSWFNDSYIAPFEHLSVKVPSGIDDILKLRYGDYMELPDIKDQAPHHIFEYVNLKERIELPEVKMRISKGELCVF